MAKHHQVVAIIPARGGSKGVPGKNIYPLGDHPLIAYSIAVAQMSEKISRILVSTDSPEIAAISRYYGAEVPFMRPAKYSQDTSLDKDFVLHAMDWLIRNEGIVPTYFVHLRPTTPLRDPLIVDQAIGEICSQQDATSLRSGHQAPESPYKWFIKDSKGFFRGLSAEFSAEYLNQPRQSLPDVYVPDGYVDVIKTALVTKDVSLHGDKIIGFVSPFCVEVDSLAELEYLEYLIDKTGHPLVEHLNKNFAKGAKDVRLEI